MKWHLVDNGLSQIVQQFSHPADKRRHYMVSQFRGDRVFIKSFREEGFIGFVRNFFLARGKIEFDRGSRIASLGILTPKVLGYGVAGSSSAIIEEYVDGATLAYTFQKTSDHQVLYTLLVDLLQQLKKGHVRHNDLHLNNILVSNQKLYLIDLHKTQIRKVFEKDDEMSNLTHSLGSIYDEMSNRERELFFSQYGCDDVTRMEIEDRIKQMKTRWVLRKKRRAFRDTSILKADNGYVYIKGSENEAIGDFVSVIKKDVKNTVELYGDHVRKIYRDKRRLKKAWENHVILTYMGLSAAPKPFFVKLPGSSKGYVAMEDLGDKGIELDRFLDRNYDEMDLKERRVFIYNFALFLESLFRKRVLHKDMKACNVFVLHGSRFVLLDIEDFIFEGFTPEKIVRAMVQLNSSIPKRISMQDRMRFFSKFISSFNVSRKQLFREIKAGSLRRDIVYEGIGGRKTENW